MIPTCRERASPGHTLVGTGRDLSVQQKLYNSLRTAIDAIHRRLWPDRSASQLHGFFPGNVTQIKPLERRFADAKLRLYGSAHRSAIIWPLTCPIAEIAFAQLIGIKVYFFSVLSAAKFQFFFTSDLEALEKSLFGCENPAPGIANAAKQIKSAC